MKDRAFFDAPSPAGDRETRREAIQDFADYVESEAYKLKRAVDDNDLGRVRRAVEELRGWVDAVEDNLR